MINQSIIKQSYKAPPRVSHRYNNAPTNPVDTKAGLIDAACIYIVTTTIAAFHFFHRISHSQVG